MKADVIPEELLREAKSDHFVGNRLRGHPEFPGIAYTDGTETVGFQLPSRFSASGEKTTGTIYIGKKHRRKGFATEALAAFLRDNPDSISHVNEANTASRKAHAKAGWVDTLKRVQGNRKATVWAKKTAAITYDEIMQGLSGQPPQRDISPEEIEALARGYRDAEAERTSFHIPVGGAIGGGLGGLLGTAFGAPKHNLVGGLVGAGIGGGLGGLAGHLRRKRVMEVRENLGRELGTVAQQGISPVSAFGGIPLEKQSRNAGQLANAVLRKLANASIAPIGAGINPTGVGKIMGLSSPTASQTLGHNMGVPRATPPPAPNYANRVGQQSGYGAKPAG